MGRASRKSVVDAVLERYGKTFAEEAGIRLGLGTPSPLYRLYCLALLHSAPIGGDLAMRATIALGDHRLRTPRAMLDAGWEARARILNRSGYARVDERTSTMLGDGARVILDRWHGDLRKLREEAGREPGRIRDLLKTLKGIGDVGSDIFFREVQGVWTEIAPFADRRALSAASRLDLGSDARALSRLVGPSDLPRLIAALVRVDRAKSADEVLAAARGAGGRRP